MRLRSFWSASGVAVAVVLASGCTADPTPSPSPTPSGADAPQILAGLLLPPSISDVASVSGLVGVVDGCIALTDSASEYDGVPIVWPIGTTITSDDPVEIVLLNGSFRIGEEISPAQGWLTTVGEIPPDTVSGIDGECTKGGNSSPLLVLYTVRGMPTQE